MLQNVKCIVGHYACKIHLRMSKLRSVSARGEGRARKIQYRGNQGMAMVAQGTTMITLGG